MKLHHCFQLIKHWASDFESVQECYGFKFVPKNYTCELTMVMVWKLRLKVSDILWWNYSCCCAHNNFFFRCFFFEFIFRLFMCSTNLWFCYEPRTYIFLCSWNRLKCGVTIGVCLIYKQFMYNFSYMWVKRKRSYFIRKV